MKNTIETDLQGDVRKGVERMCLNLQKKLYWRPKKQKR